MKFSELVTNLTEMWLLWMKHNSIVRDETMTTIERKTSDEECEKLINLEYEITENLDSFFKNE